MRAVLLLLACLLAPGLAQADPITATAFLATYIGGTAAAFLVTYAGTIAMVSIAAYSTISARSKAAKARAQARAAYNAGLQDRNVTVLSADPPRRAIYGRCEVGGAVVAMFTTDKRRLDGSTKPDAYKHLVIVWASHQCHAIHDIKIDGVSIGALSGDGSATGSSWAQPDAERLATVTAGGNETSVSLPYVVRVVSVSKVDTSEGGGTYAPPEGGPDGWSLSGWTLTLPVTTATGGWEISYLQSPAAQNSLGNPIAADSTVSVRHHLGAADQAADARLIELLPDQWTAAHQLRGLCYSVVTLDLERSQFQGGPPGITAEISGKLVLDRRSGLTAWSDNPALCTDDWLRSDLGYSVALADVDAASVIAAANACDVSTNFTTGTTTTTEPRYTCNGVISAEMGKEAVLQDLCESMGGWASYGGNWRLMAGAWVPPVMPLTDDDLAGPISIVQAGEPSGELFNSVRCQYVPAGSAVPAEGEPYKNATFAAADGRTLWRDVDLPFTNAKPRAKNLCRIQTEQVRNGLVIHYPSKLKAWRLQTGDRVTITSAEYGFAGKTFRVIDWQFGLTSPVGLTLQEDAADAYDDADATVADPTPNTQLPDPWSVPALTGLSLFSGTAELQRLGDGTVISRVRAVWPRSTAAYMDGGRIELSWRAAGSNVWTEVNAAGDDTEAYLTGVKDGSLIVVSAVVVNGNRARSPARVLSHFVLGKSQAPRVVEGLTAAVIPGAVRISWAPSTEPDYAETILRVGASWAAGTPLPRIGPVSSYDWLWPNLGSYTIWAAHLDSTGNVGVAVSTAVTVTSSLIPDGAVTVTGGTVVKTGGGSGWNAAVRSKDGCAGGAYASWAIPQAGFSFGVGLNTDPATDASFASIDWWFYFQSDQTAYAFKDGVNVTGSPICTWAAGDLCSITYDGSTIRMLQNGVVRFSAPATITAPLHLDATFDSVGGSVTNLQFGPLSSNNWTAVGGRPLNLTIRCMGNGSPNPPANWWNGVRNAETGALIQNVKRSWGYVEFNRAGTLVNGEVFDVYGNGEIGGTGYDFLYHLNNYITKGNILAVYTFDEPLNNFWQTAGLADKLIANGASRSMLKQIKSGGCYIMVGIVGCGEGRGSEVVTEGGGPNSWAELSFSIFKGALNVSGISGGPKSVKDLDYAGDLDATKGAPAGTYVGNNLAQDLETLAGAQARADAAAVLAVNAAAIAAQAKADLAETNAKAYADGIVTPAEARAIAAAQVKADAAQAAATAAAAADATAKANVAATLANWTGVTGRPYDYEQDSDPSPVTPGSTWRVPSTGRTYRMLNGAWQPYVGAGSIGTGEIALGAATQLAEKLVASVEITGSSHTGGVDNYAASFSPIAFISFTPDYTGIANLYITASLHVEGVYAYSVADVDMQIVVVNVDLNGDGWAQPDENLVYWQQSQFVKSGSNSMYAAPIAGRMQVSVQAGLTKTLWLHGSHIGSSPAVVQLKNIRLGLEGVKR